MKILLFGKNGQIGRELQNTLPRLGEVKTYDSQTANFEDTGKLRKIITSETPEIIINAAAYTAVDKAESEFEKAGQINGKAVKILAEEAKKHKVWLIHYSTDYVFDGEKAKPYVETDTPNPLNVYGKTKLLGEEAIKEINGQYLIFRVSGIYSPHGSNFLKTILRLAQEKDEIKVIFDQFCTPTSAKFIANTTTLIIDKINNLSSFQKRNFNNKSDQTMNPKQISGIYHLTPTGKVSWYDFATYIIHQAGENKITLRVKPKDINPISTDSYPSLTKRPKDSRLDSTKISKTFGIKLPEWKTHVREFIEKRILEEKKT